MTHKFVPSNNDHKFFQIIPIQFWITSKMCVSVTACAGLLTTNKQNKSRNLTEVIK